MDSARLGPGDYSGMKGYRYCRHQEHDPAVPRTAGAFLRTHSPFPHPTSLATVTRPRVSLSRVPPGTERDAHPADPAVDFCGREARSRESANARTRAAHCEAFARPADPALSELPLRDHPGGLSRNCERRYCRSKRTGASASGTAVNQRRRRINEIERRLSLSRARARARRGKVIARHYRAGNGSCTAIVPPTESGFSLRCDYVYCPFRPTSRKSRKTARKIATRDLRRAASARSFNPLLSSHSRDADKTANYPND
jgi:hypothetical protein